MPVLQVSGVYPHVLTKGVIPRDIPNGLWQRVSIPASSAYTITPLGSGVDFAIRVQLRGDTAATEASLNVTFNSDATSANYHWQRVGANNNAAAVGEGTTADVTLFAAATAVSGVYTSLLLYFPEYRSARQKFCYVSGGNELSATNQRVMLAILKRQTAGSGALTDVLSSFRLAPSAGNFDGDISFAEIPA